MGEIFSTVKDFVGENQVELVALATAFVVVFAAIAKRTANKTDDTIASVLKRWLRIP